MVRIINLFSGIRGFSTKPTLADRLRHRYESMLLWCAYNIARLPRADPPYPKEMLEKYDFTIEDYTIFASPPCIEEE